MRSREINLVLADLARAHHQLIRTDLAAELGVSRAALDRRCGSGLLEKIDENIFRTRSSADSWHQRALAAVWAHGPEARLSHRSAARLWRLDSIPPGPTEVLVPRWRRRQRRPDVRVHETTQLLPADATVVEGIPCTTPVRTLLDLAGVVHAVRVDQLFEDALRKRLCTTEQVADRFASFARRGRRGTRVMRRLIEKRVGRSVPTMSEFERRFLELVREHGFPHPRLQHPVQLAEGRAYLDFAWPACLVGAECDGLYDHGTNIRLVWDDDRQNELTVRGWLVLRFTWETLARRPGVVVRQLRDALARPHPPQLAS